jgi:hypothetical protein
MSAACQCGCSGGSTRSDEADRVSVRPLQRFDRVTGDPRGIYLPGEGDDCHRALSE